jgi:glycerophosphoryl diester phosphodiesterase
MGPDSMDGRPLVVAHRGASHDRVENTVEAFAEARVQGAEWVELDVRLSADDVLMVHHDAHYTDGRLVREVRAADAPDHVPNLAEAFEACEGMGVNVEVKNLPGDPDHDASAMVCEAVAGLAVAYRPPELLLVSSFDITAVDRIRATDPSLPTAWLVAERQGTDLTLDRTVAHGHGAVNPWDELVDEHLVSASRDRGLDVFVWTVDDPGRMAELAEWGVDGIVTNRPGVARAVIDGRRDGFWVDG